ncbi:MAG: rhomboid family intramembrane serine protease, partial [Bacteroidetes bacterium]|nr:rhomboid family intramembrane serine protease [Bacteroidota bacterium]
MYYGSENQYRQNPLDNLKGFFKNKNMLIKLILVNVLVWLAIMFLSVIFDLYKADYIQEVINRLAVPADIEQLVIRPWTVFTYMFLHYDFWHILFNMLWLFWFGKIFMEFLNQRQLLATYIIGGLAGAVFYILSFNLFPKFEDIYQQSVALGASASVMAVVVAISFYVPNYRINLLFIGPVKILYIALISIVLDVLMIKSANSGGHLAHLGGALWGFFSIYLLKNRIDVSSVFGKLSFAGIKNTFKTKKSSRFRKVYTNSRVKTDEEYNHEKKLNQEKIDEILDKISKSGYDNLTKQEKEFLG